MEFAPVVLFVVWLLVVMVLIGNELGFAAMMVTLAAVGISQIGLGNNVVGSIISHRYEILLWILGYLIVGALVSMLKWYSFVLSQKTLYKTDRMQWLQMKGYKDATLETSVPNEVVGEWKTNIDRRNVRGWNVKASQHVSTLTRWCAWWWVVLVVDILDSFFHNVFVAIFRYLATTYQRIADHVYADTTADFNEKK